MSSNIPDPSRNGQMLIWQPTYDFTNNFFNERPNLQVGLEVGVAGGMHIKSIMENTKIKKMFGVDPYSSESWDMFDFLDLQKEYGGFDGLYKEVSQLLSSYGNRASLIRKTSKQASLDFENESLDFVFIDAAHDYKNCLNDITLWHPKVKVGGYVMGHDWEHPSHPGVQKAVLEYYKDRKNFIRGLPTPYHVWYIQK
jgi:hypothetical protein